MESDDSGDEALQSSPRGVDSPERTREPHPSGDGLGASFLSLILCHRQSPSSSSPSSSSSFRSGRRVFQSDIELVPSPRWLSPSPMPHRPPPNPGRRFFFDPKPTVNINYVFDATTQMIVFSVQMDDERRRSKAMKIVVGMTGVLSAAIVIEGSNKNQIVVIGEGVDFVTLTKLLKKWMGFAQLVNVSAPKKKQENEEETTESTVQQAVICIEESTAVPQLCHQREISPPDDS